MQTCQPKRWPLSLTHPFKLSSSHKSDEDLCMFLLHLEHHSQRSHKMDFCKRRIRKARTQREFSCYGGCRIGRGIEAKRSHSLYLLWHGLELGGVPMEMLVMYLGNQGLILKRCPLSVRVLMKNKMW